MSKICSVHHEKSGGFTKRNMGVNPPNQTLKLSVFFCNITSAGCWDQLRDIVLDTRLP